MVNNLCRHKLTSKGIKKYQCNEGSIYELDWSKHTIGHSGIKLDVCNKGFNYFIMLSRHKLIYSCNIKRCQYIVRNKACMHASLPKFVLYDIGLKNCHCDVDNKASANVCNISEYPGMRKDQGDVCNKAFTYASFPRYELIFSRSMKKNRYDVCTEAFTYLQYLSRHKFIPIGIKNYHYIYFKPVAYICDHHEQINQQRYKEIYVICVFNEVRSQLKCMSEYCGSQYIKNHQCVMFVNIVFILTCSLSKQINTQHIKKHVVCVIDLHSYS